MVRTVISLFLPPFSLSVLSFAPLSSSTCHTMATSSIWERVRTFHLTGDVKSEVQYGDNNLGKWRVPRSPNCWAIWNPSLTWNKMLLCFADSWPLLICPLRTFEESNTTQGQVTSVPGFLRQNAIFRLSQKHPVLPATKSSNYPLFSAPSSTQTPVLTLHTYLMGSS